MGLSVKIRGAFGAALAVMLGMGIAAVLQTYAWEGSATWLARTWDVISRLDALDAQLKGTEASAARLVGGSSDRPAVDPAGSRL